MLKFGIIGVLEMLSGENIETRPLKIPGSGESYPGKSLPSLTALYATRVDLRGLSIGPCVIPIGRVPVNPQGSC